MSETTRPGSSTPAAYGTLVPESVIADRYRIVRFIARGGMGEVYEAEDIELRERVALKTIRPDAAGDESTVARFKREIQLARKVTHPNVARIFDLGHHQSAAGMINFLTMELLDGETLSERLKRTGRLSTDEAFPLVEQMVAALGAAHKAGVVHRDFKTANVILVPSGDGVRAVVTDFGLARGPVGGESTPSGAIIGTLEYMAPEQMEGEAVTKEVDIYALGILLYTMVTGAMPFSGDTPFAVAIKRLKEAPSPPRTHVPDLDPRWERAILRCLERNPEDRFGNVEDVLSALRAETMPGQREVTASAPLPVGYRPALVALVLLVTLALAGVLYFRANRHPDTSSSNAIAPARGRHSVAVLGFKNLSGRPDAQWLSTALSEMLTSELAAGEKLRMIPGENVARMKIDLSLPDTESLAKDTLSRIHDNLGTDFVIAGSYVDLGKETGGQIRIDLILQDTIAGETIASVGETGTEARLFDLVSQVGERLRNKLGIQKLTPSETQGVQASLPSNPEAARLYSEGLARLRLFDSLSACELLEKAIAVDPNYPLAHSALAEAYSNLGYDIKAKEQAKKAFDLSENLSREEKLLIEGRYRETAGESDRAIEIYKTLFSFFPDNVEYGLKLFNVEDFADRSEEALRTLETLRKLPPPAGDDPRISLAECLADTAASDWPHFQATAARTVQAAEKRGMRLLVGEVLMREGWVYQRQGDFDRARSVYESAQQIFSASGNDAQTARSLLNIAYGLQQRGDFAGAMANCQKGLELLTRIGNKGRMAAALNLMGIVSWRQGRLKDSIKAYQKAVAVDQEIGDEGNMPTHWNNMALVLTDQGKLADAGKLYQDALSFARQRNNKYFMGWILYGLGRVLIQQGDLPGARKDLEESLVIRKANGMKGDTADTLTALAALCVEEGRPADSFSPIQDAIQEYRVEKRTSDEGLSTAVLADALLAQNKIPEAQKAINDATALLQGYPQDFYKRNVLNIVAARVRAASAKPADLAGAEKSLNDTIAETTRAGFVGLQFDARLALGEIEMKSGQVAAGRAELATLKKDAGEKGYQNIVRKADTLPR